MRVEDQGLRQWEEVIGGIWFLGRCRPDLNRLGRSSVGLMQAARVDFLFVTLV